MVILEDSGCSYKLTLATDYTRRRMLKRLILVIDLSIDVSLRHSGILQDRRGARCNLRFGSVGRTSILRAIESALSVEVRTMRRPNTSGRRHGQGPFKLQPTSTDETDMSRREGRFRKPNQPYAGTS